MKVLTGTSAYGIQLTNSLGANMDPCPFCEELAKYDFTDADSLIIYCPICGTYEITRTVLAVVQSRPCFLMDRDISSDIRKKANISGWLRENSWYRVTSDNYEKLSSLKTPSFHDRADKLLMMLQKSTTFAGEKIKRDTSWISSAWCINENELSEIISYLSSSAMISLSNLGDLSECKIAPTGWARLDQLRKINTESLQGFVAMWFDDALKKIYDDVIATAVMEAGYKPHRVDQREHNCKIDDEIIAEIRRSRFVLADFTGHRGGVYYEAGFAMGLGVEVFWTCRKDDIDNLHFDIRQYNCIEWEPDKLDAFKKRITLRIESVIGRGTYNGRL